MSKGKKGVKTISKQHDVPVTTVANIKVKVQRTVASLDKIEQKNKVS